MAAAPAWGGGPLPVVTTSTDLQSLVEAVGGEAVRVQSLAPPIHEPHAVEVKPGQLAELKSAALLVRIGLDHEPWLDRILKTVNDPRFMPRGSAVLDASRGIALLETETPRVRSERGVHVHGFGNPHYWLDPENGRRLARGIATRLAQLRPQDAPYFEQRFQDFSRRLAEAEKRWDAQMQPYRGRKVVTYHRSWPNFTRRFGLQVMGEVEPRPGIPPGPRHTIELMAMMKREGVKVILVEPYFDLKTPNSIASGTGAKVVVLLPSVGGEKEAPDYFKLFDYDLGALSRAFQGQ